MRKLVVLAAVLVPVIVVATLPASVVLERADTPAALRDPGGTLWRGQAEWRQPGQRPLAVNWHFAGRDWRWRAEDDDTRIEGRWRPLGEGTTLTDIAGRLAVRRVDLGYWLVDTRPRGWLEIDLDRLLIANGAAPRARGRIVWREAALVGAVQESLGDIELALDDAGGGQHIRIRSLTDADIHVRGTIVLDADGYRLDVRLRAAADRPALARQLARLGEPQPDGQVRVRFSGSLGW